MKKPKPSTARLGRMKHASSHKRPQINRYRSRLLASGKESSERGALAVSETLTEQRLKIAGTTAISVVYLSSIIHAGVTGGLSYAFTTGLLMLPVAVFGFTIYLFND